MKLQENFGFTSLFIAVDKNHFDCVKLLMEEAGMQIKRGYTALLDIVQHEHNSIVIS